MAPQRVPPMGFRLSVNLSFIALANIMASAANVDMKIV
jgi:hypothetical protein